jgi:hypothetical protein
MSEVVKIRAIRGRDHRRGCWNKEAEYEDRRYLLGAARLGTNWLVRVKGVETGKVVEDLAVDLHDSVPTQRKLVERLAAEHDASAS